MNVAVWVRTAYGTSLLVWPQTVTGLLGRSQLSVAGRTVVRILGLREAGQALVCAPRPTAAVLRLGAGIDMLHALTMLGFATRSSTWRRPALASMTVAATFAAIARYDAGRLPRSTTGGPLPLTTDTHARLLEQLLDVRDRCAMAVAHAGSASKSTHTLLGGI